jgi:hypothetical protein
MTLNKTWFLGVGAVALSIGLGSMAIAGTPVATISGGYDEDSYDTPELIINDTTNYEFSNIQMVLTPYQPGTDDYTTAPQTVSLSNVAPNSSNEVIWGSGGPFFANDFDDDWGNNISTSVVDSSGYSCVQPYSYCTYVGNFSVTLTATWDNPAYGPNGVEISSVFSPTSNATGGFVGWEGLDPSGLAETVFDAHSGAITGTLAYINIGPPTSSAPEPSAWALMLSGIGMLGMLLRRRAASVASFLSAG